MLSCNYSEKKIEVDQSKHIGLTELETDHPYSILYSNEQIEYAKKQAELIDEAYLFLSRIMGPKKDFCLLVIE